MLDRTFAFEITSHCCYSCQIGRKRECEEDKFEMRKISLNESRISLLLTYNECAYSSYRYLSVNSMAESLGYTLRAAKCDQRRIIDF